MTAPSTSDRIAAIEAAKAHLEAAVALLRDAHPEDPQLGKAANANSIKWHIMPLEREVQNCTDELTFLRRQFDIDAAECFGCTHVRGLHQRSGCNGVVEVDEGMKPKLCPCTEFTVVTGLTG